jgi:tetratricopeptide (TPR) repeat protein
LKYTPKFWILFLTALLLLGTSCSTRKSKFGNRAYHTLTSKYNVNFNAKEALKKGMADLDKKRQDNYLEILPIYYYAPKQELTSTFPSFDRVIEKSSKAVYKHSILLRGKEYVKMMNDAYMMMGKAYFYKQDYIQAKRVFHYVIATYDWGSVEEATIWLSRCELQQNYGPSAKALLDDLSSKMYQKKIKSTTLRDDDELKVKSKSPPKKSKSKYNKYNKKKTTAVKKNSKKSNKKKTDKRKVTNNTRLQYYAAEAEYNLLSPDGDIEDAIDNIKIALQYKPKKAFRVRLNFILGQLYEKTDNRKAAQNWFLKVIRATPEYEMEFSARMHLAVNYDGTSLSKKTIMKELNKMLKDSKNEDYRDQIYYAISEIARIDEDDADREFYLAKSVAAYTRNDYQRTYSAVTLADIYFNEEEYVQAQAYYDTALMSLSQNFPDRENIIKKAGVLNDLVEQLNMIQLQDSLQRIAKMSDNERRAWVAKMIANYTEEERRLAKEEADRLLAFNATRDFMNIDVNTQGQSNKWYFYNPGLVSQGATEFYRRFGNRKLEDNWIISNKIAMSFEDMVTLNEGGETQEMEELDEDGNPIKKRETDPKKPEYYTQDLPMTQGAIDTSNVMIVNAMYNAGIIYFDQLNDLKRSNEMLMKLIARFPNHDFVLPCYFILWSNYTKMKNTAKAEEIKNIILSKYPDTDYAKLIQDPNYYKKLAEAAQENDRKYEQLFRTYNSKQWQRTVQLADELLELTENETLMAKTTYLRAVAMGQLQGNEVLKEDLMLIIKNYPKEQVTELAKILLSTLTDSKQILELLEEETQQDFPSNTVGKESPFNPNLDEPHYIMILVDVHKKVVNDVKYDVANFNSTYFNLERFNINSFYINQDEQLVSITRFKGKTDAMNYYTALTTNDVFAPSIQDKSLTVYAISATNYSTFYGKSDDRRMYKQFFNENYLKK